MTEKQPNRKKYEKYKYRGGLKTTSGEFVSFSEMSFAQIMKWVSGMGKSLDELYLIRKGIDAKQRATREIRGDVLGNLGLSDINQK